MKSIANQYKDLKEGKMTQSNFMRNLRMTMPQYITNVTSFNDAVRILKNKAILTETLNENRAFEVAKRLKAEGMDEDSIYVYLVDDMGLSGMAAQSVIDDLFNGTNESSSLGEYYDGPSEPIGDEAFGDYYEMVGEQLEEIARKKYNLDEAELEQMFESEWHSGVNDKDIEKAFDEGIEPSVMAERIIEKYINMDDDMFDDMIKRSEDELSPDKYKFDDFEGGLSEAKEIKVDGKIVKNYKQNGDKSYNVEFEDGSKKQIYVSHDDWDNINNDNLEKKELNEAKKKKEPLHPNQIHPGELRMGIRVEMEHTDDPKKAEKIALDHLAENPFYYTALKLAGVESPSAPKVKAPAEKKAKKKKEAVELVDKANAMQKVKMPKIVKEAQISAALPNEEINNTTKQVLQYVDSDIANPVLKSLSKDIKLQSLRDNRTLLRYMYWEPLPDPAIRALELQFKVEGDTDIDDDTAPREYYILSPKSNIAKNLGSSLETGASKASQMDVFKEALEKLVREALAETFDGRDNLANITDDTK